MSVRWVPILGRFDYEGNDVVFRGQLIDRAAGSDTKKQALVGRVLSNQVFNGGTVSVDVNFTPPEAEFGPPNYPIIAEIVFNDPVTNDMVTAGIGGEYFFYCARTWDEKNQKWLGTVMKGGYIGQVKLDVTHTISVTVQSSYMRLLIDGVQVAWANLPYPIIGNQIGLFCQCAVDIKFSNLSIESQKPRVFVVMPFSGPYNDLYRHVFQPVCTRCQLEPHRSDNTYGPGLIIADIVQRIMQSHIIIAEITPNPPNANVYFEVGFAMAMRKPLILIADKDCPEALPFDISPFRVMFYENTIAGKHDIQLELVKHLNTILPGYAPITNYYCELSKESPLN